VVNGPEWDRRQNEPRESATALRSGEMPPRRYAWSRPASRLSTTERQDLFLGLEATLGSRRAGTKGGTVEGIAITE
jgi:hypothetical protein